MVSPRMENVFYDHLKMFKGTQDENLKKMLRHKKGGIADMKRTKIISSLNPHE